MTDNVLFLTFSVLVANPSVRNGHDESVRGGVVSNSCFLFHPENSGTEVYFFKEKVLYLWINYILHIFSPSLHRYYFQHAHFVPIVGVGKRGAY